jgi:hypothetical protein
MFLLRIRRCICIFGISSGLDFKIRPARQKLERRYAFDSFYRGNTGAIINVGD